MARKRGQFFEPVKMPRGGHRERIEAAHAVATGKKRASASLTKNLLDQLEGHISEENLNWMSISFYFGLRPKEVDRLHEKKWKVDLVNGVQILRVEQTKLIHLPIDKRLKFIPILYKEQQDALKAIKDGRFVRPLVKTLKKYCSEEIDTYAGRKGFTDWMLNKGQNLEDISLWLGHRSIDTTWRHYKDKQKITFTKTKGILRLVKK